MTVAERPHRVVIAGGGFAAVEALLALRAYAEDRVTLELVAPDELLRNRPSATGQPFGVTEVQTFSLPELCERAGARFRRDAVASVASGDHTLRLASGAVLGYDSLLLALGARRRAGVPGALTFRDERDAGRLRAIVDSLGAGRTRRVVFAAPAGVSWTLPLYELALLTARELEDAQAFAEVALVTPERRPLEVFGSAGGTVAELLARHDVRVIADAHPRAVTRQGLALRYGGTLRADHVVTVPELAGPRLRGIPAGWSGFVATDAAGRVDGCPGVFAIGDMTDYPVKQGGLAAQAADTAGGAIAAGLGLGSAGAEPRVLRAAMLGSDQPLYLRAELDDRGRPVGGEVTDELPWWPAGKIFGRHLSPVLAELAAAPPLPATAA